MKQKFILLASIAIGLIAATLSFVWLHAKNREIEAAKARYVDPEQIKIVAAYRTLPSGTTIQRDDIASLSIAAKTMTNDHILLDDYEKIIGRPLVQPLEKGTPVLWTYIHGGQQRGRNLSEDIKEKMRAVSIPVSGASGVSGMVRPNDCVDVLGSFVLPSQGGTSTLDEMEMVTLTVLQNVTVLAIGSDTQRTLSDRKNNSGYGTVTLQVTPREAEVLVFAQQMKGKLFLTLRNPSDVYFEPELPRIDFNQIESELKSLNQYRQEKIRRVPTAR